VVVRAGSLEIVGAGDDAIDAAVVGLASDDDHIITSDADDIQRLVGAAGIHVDVIPV
nr:hypothetical protein [Acidimicrobiia bacterium]